LTVTVALYVRALCTYKHISKNRKQIWRKEEREGEGRRAYLAASTEAEELAKHHMEHSHIPKRKEMNKEGEREEEERGGDTQSGCRCIDRSLQQR